MTRYSDDFFAQTFHQGYSAAKELIPLLAEIGVSPRFVVDIGGGAGGWLVPFSELEARTTLVDQIPESIESRLDSRVTYLACDLEDPQQLARIPRADLAICVEVLEHLSPDAAEAVIDQIARSSKTIVFSAAWDGQGGEHHINERPLNDWLDEWKRRGFLVADVLRSRMTTLPRYYQTNLVLCTQDEELAKRLIGHARFVSDSGIPDQRTAGEKRRGALLRHLPAALVTKLARVSHTLRR